MQTASQIIQPNDKFVVRTPLYSQELFKEIFGNETVNEETVKELLKNDLIRESIYISTPSLYNEIDKVLSNEITDQKKLKKFWKGIYKYLIRMSTRTTPFGLFAGVGVAKWGEKSDIKIALHNDFKRHTRIDMHIVVAISQFISKIPEVRKQLLFYPNTSLYSIAGQLRYIEYKYIHGNRKHSTVAIDDNEYIQVILSKAEKGATIVEISQEIVEDEIPLADAIYFVEELIETQLLIPELEPTLTGDEFEKQLIEKLKALTPDSEGIIEKVINVLIEIEDLIKDIDQTVLKQNVGLYQKIIEKLKTIGIDFDKQFIIQTDMSLGLEEKTLDKNLRKDICAGLDVLNRLYPKNPKNSVEAFARAFYNRYESQEVPLTEVVDMELGLGYPVDGPGMESNPLIDDILLPMNTGNIPEMQWFPAFSYLLKKYEEEVVLNQNDEIIIRDEEMKAFPIDWNDFPHSFSAVVNVLGKNKDGKDLLFMEFAGGTSGTYLMTRFCHSNEDVKELVHEISDLENEIYDKSVLAEVVHLPKARTGNIIMRPAFRSYEIPYLARSEAKNDNQIPVTDLMVSVHGDKVMLRSKKLNKYVLPKLSTAENYVRADSLPLYKFLCDVQHNNSRGGTQFSWGPLKDMYCFLPRVKYKNIILSLAQWNLKKEQIKDLHVAVDQKNLIETVSKWRKKLKIPEKVFLNLNDNQLLINLKNKESIIMWLSEVKNEVSFVLEEYVFDGVNNAVQNCNGSYHSEFIIPFSYKKMVNHA